MKKNFTIGLLAVLSIIIFGSSSCKKEKCTDALAKNYNATGDCSYEGTVVFWQDEALAQSAVDAGITTWSFFIDGGLVGTMSAGAYSASGAPTCGTSGFLTVKQSLGNSKTKAINIIVRSEDGDETNFIVPFVGGLCKDYELQ